MTMRKILLIGLPAILLFGGLIIGTTLYLNRPAKQTQKVCKTTSCLNHAKYIMEMIDTKVDPCDSFYQFTCGNFLKRQLNDDESSISSFKIALTNLNEALSDILSKPIESSDDITVANVKKFYSSCMNLDQVNSNSENFLLKIINDELGGWPLLTNKENSLTIVELMIRINTFKLSSIQSIYVGTNPKDPKARVIRISQPTVINKEYYQNVHFLNAYKDFIKTSLTYLNTTILDPTSQINDVLELSSSLAKVQMTPVEVKTSVYVNMTIKELQTTVPSFPWKELIISGLYKDKPSVVIDENEYVIIDNWNYTVAAARIFDDYIQNKKLVLQNYLLLQVFGTFLSALPIKYLEAKIGYEKFITGEFELKTRTKYCAELTTNSLPMAVGKIYVAERFDSSSKVNVFDMAKNMVDQFKIMMNSVTWMDEASKKMANEKADAIKTQIGYPNNIFNETYLNKHYGVTIAANTLLENVYYISKREFFTHFDELRLPKDKDEWGFTPAQVNAFYDPETNQIFFPAGILQPPFYYNDLPNYINYGSIGAAIGHEITHGFDDSGRLYDKDGVYFSEDEAGLWTNTTSNKFKEHSKCMIDQYSNYLVKSINRTINGYQTLGENIADNGGIKESFKAYQKWVQSNGEELLLPGINYNQKQLFFISLGMLWCTKSRDETLTAQVLSDPHSPAEFRVTGMSSNYDEFGKAFNCKPKSSNKDCSVW